MYTLEQLEQMLEDELRLNKELKRDLRFNEQEIKHLKDCIKVEKEKIRGYEK